MSVEQGGQAPLRNEDEQKAFIAEYLEEHPKAIADPGIAEYVAHAAKFDEEDYAQLSKMVDRNEKKLQDVIEATNATEAPIAKNSDKEYIATDMSNGFADVKYDNPAAHNQHTKTMKIKEARDSARAAADAAGYNALNKHLKDL